MSPIASPACEKVPSLRTRVKNCKLCLHMEIEFDLQRDKKWHRGREMWSERCGVRGCLEQITKSQLNFFFIATSGMFNCHIVAHSCWSILWSQTERAKICWIFKFSFLCKSQTFCLSFFLLLPLRAKFIRMARHVMRIFSLPNDSSSWSHFSMKISFCRCRMENWTLSLY